MKRGGKWDIGHIFDQRLENMARANLADFPHILRYLHVTVSSGHGVIRREEEKKNAKREKQEETKTQIQERKKREKEEKRSKMDRIDDKSQ